MIALLTNDDGINAPGFAALREVAKKLGLKTVCMAPFREQSGIGSGRTFSYVHMERAGPDAYTVYGTPADCVCLGLSPVVRRALKLPRFNLVLSGVNYGANVGREAIMCSGTLAAAEQAAYRGVPGIAISQDVRDCKRREDLFRLDRVAEVLREVIGKIPKHPAIFSYNVNLPAEYRDTGRMDWLSDVDLAGGYVGDWESAKGPPGGATFRWNQRWRESQGFTDVRLLDMGCVTITFGRVGYPKLRRPKKLKPTKKA